MNPQANGALATPPDTNYPVYPPAQNEAGAYPVTASGEVPQVEALQAPLDPSVAPISTEFNNEVPVVETASTVLDPIESTVTPPVSEPVIEATPVTAPVVEAPPVISAEPVPMATEVLAPVTVAQEKTPEIIAPSPVSLPVSKEEQAIKDDSDTIPPIRTIEQYDKKLSVPDSKLDMGAVAAGLESHVGRVPKKKAA